MAYTTIKKPSDYFNTKLYTGTGSSNAITGVGFQPDFTWIKDRDNSRNHQLYDAIRGAGYVLYSDLTNAQGDDINRLSSFDSDGFSLGTSADVNDSSQKYASWNWLANGTGSANTDGSISSTVSANTTSGFSIVSYTGNGTNNNTATIGHGLGVAPSMIIVKGINATASWITTNTINGWNNVLELNSTAANAANTYAFGSTGIPPTSTVFTVAAASGQHHTNTNGGTYIAYCFAEKQGYSKFGSYTGNGNDDGTFVYLGFKPAWVLFKQTNTTNEWFIWDVKRDIFNPLALYLLPNSSGAEGGSGNTYMDYVSNGIKLRSSNGAFNGSGGTYIYMAFAEQPLVGDNPATAR